MFKKIKGNIFMQNVLGLYRYLPDNRNMMIIRSSGRSGFIYMVNV